MVNERWISLAGHLILLQLLWPAAVFGAIQGVTWPGVLIVLAMPCWSLARGLPPRRDLRMAFTGILMGAVFETVLLGLGLVEYRLMAAPGLAPVWILMLWAGFALHFHHCLAWLRRRRGWAAVLGALGGPVSVLIGAGLGAATLPRGPLALVLFYGACWALLVPLLAWLAEQDQQRETGMAS